MTGRQVLRGLIALAFGALATARPAMAGPQTLLTSVRGVVRDASAAVLVGAEVTLTNRDTAQRRREMTAGDGTFQFIGVVPGPYRLTCARDGFAPWTRELLLTIDQHLTLVIELAIAAQRQGVTVRADEVSALETTTVSLGRTIRTEEIERLPLRASGSATFVALAAFAPGVLTVDIANGTLNTIVTAGQPSSANAIHVDNASMDGLGLSSGPPTIAVQEFRAVSNHSSPEFGQSSGVVLNVVTRSGSNRVVGRLSYLGQNSAWNATSAPVKEAGAADPGSSQHSVQGFFGGPLAINRTFIFAAAESTAINTVYANTSEVTPLFRPNEPAAMPVHVGIPKPFVRLDVQTGSHLLTGTMTYQRITNDNAAREPLSVAERGRRLDDRSRDLAVRYTTTPGRSAVNEVRVKWSVNRFDRSVDDFCPGCLALNYPGILLGKPANDPQLRVSDRRSVADVLTWWHAGRTGRHGITAGIAADVVSVYTNQPQNLVGTYQFLDAIPFDAANPASYPWRFTQNLGSPETTVRQAVFAAFAQDRWQPREGISLTAGVRWDRTRWPGPSSLRVDAAPRLGLAVRPWPRRTTILRAAAGRYYDEISLDIARAAEPRFITITIANPGYQGDLRVFDPTASSPLGGARRTISTTDYTTTRTPYTDQASLGVEQQAGRIAFTADVVRARGRRQPIRRDLNYPDPVTRRRPDPDPTILQKNVIETTAHSWYTGLQVGVQSRLAGRYSYSAAYTWSSAENDTGGFCALPQCYAADQNDVLADRGPTLADARHTLTASTTLDLGFGLRLAAIFSGRTGLPYNVTTGFDDNRDGVNNDRPAGRGRNDARGAAAFQADVRMSRWFVIGGRRLELLAEAFNLTNRPNWTNYEGSMRSGQFSQPGDALPPRQIQLGVRLDFR